MLRSSAYPGRWLVVASFALAALSAAVVVLWLTLGDDTLLCDFGEASSFYGTAERSWVPPGRTCTWTANGIAHVDRPDPSRMAVVAMALLGGPLGLYLRRLLRPADDEDSVTAPPDAGS